MTRPSALSERQQEIADALIDSGRFASIDQVIDEGLRLVAGHRPTDEEKLATLRAAVQEGIDDLENGRFVEFATTEALEAHLDDLLADVGLGKRSE